QKHHLLACSKVLEPNLPLCLDVAFERNHGSVTRCARSPGARPAVGGYTFDVLRLVVSQRDPLDHAIPRQSCERNCSVARDRRLGVLARPEGQLAWLAGDSSGG